MVTKYGMSAEVMEPVAYGENEEEVFLGRSVTQAQSEYVRGNCSKKLTQK